MKQCDPQTDKMDEEEEYDADNLNSISSSNEKSLDTIILKDEGSEFQEGGIRGWATVIGA